jgi:hypothetical protein
MSISSGSTVMQWRNIFYTTTATALLILIISCIAGPSIYKRVKHHIGPSGGIASLLGLVSNSEELLRAVQPLRHICNPNERMEYLREVDAAYTCRNVTARHLSGGYTYGIEMVDRRREGHRVR